MNISLKPLVTLCVIAGVLAACGKKEQPGNPQDSTGAPQDTAMASAKPESAAPPAPYIFFNIDSLRAVLETGKHRIDQELTDPSKVKDYLNTLPGNDPASIPYAIHFIRNYPAPAGSSAYDTLYKQFTSLYYLVSVAFSRVVQGPTCDVVLNRNHVGRLTSTDPLPDDPELKNLLAYLDLYSLKIYISEGGYYTSADPELYYNVFQRKASPALVYYLTLQKKDLKEGFADDNMLLITYPQLYKRIEAWGSLIAMQTDGFLKQEALRTYRNYLSALLLGLGNTPTFDAEKQTLNPEVKNLYETIMASGKDHVSKKIVTDYYNLLAKNDFKRTDSVNTFLNQYKLAALFKQQV